MCDDKNSQSTKFIHMRSVTKPNNMCLPKPPIQSSYQTSLCSDKNSQSTRCYKKKYPASSVCDDRNSQSTRSYKKKCPMRPVCNDKNCQSAKCAHMQQRAMLQSTYKESSSKKTCK